MPKNMNKKYIIIKVQALPTVIASSFFDQFAIIPSAKSEAERTTIATVARKTSENFPAFSNFVSHSCNGKGTPASDKGT